VYAAVLLQVLDDGRIKHYFAGTDMKKQVSCAPGMLSTAMVCAADRSWHARGHALATRHFTAVVA
jgi:hypothetical protein